MAYICTAKTPCEKCWHWRDDPDRPGRKSCFAQQDEDARETGTAPVT